MLELGDESKSEHVAVIRSAAARGFAKVCFVGKEFMAASNEAGFGDCCVDAVSDAVSGAGNLLFFETSDALAEWLHSVPLSGATILIKGSRGTRMEKTIPAL